MTAYRFQLAGYRDEIEYLDINKGTCVRNFSPTVNANDPDLILCRLIGGSIIIMSRNFVGKTATSIITTKPGNVQTRS